MAFIFNTQTFLVDPNGPPSTANILDKNEVVEEVAILTNTLLANGVRQITLGVIYNDGIAPVQHFVSFETVRVGHGATPVANIALADVGTGVHTNFLEHGIVDNTMQVTIITVSTGVAGTHAYSTKNVTLDPSDNITDNSEQIDSTDPLGLEESILINTGSIAKPSDVGAGTIRGTILTVST